MFKKYQHLERIGTVATEGLLNGECWVFPKLDGTNASVWFDEKKGIQAGSRTRTLSEGQDNAGFCKFVYNDPKLIAFFLKYPKARLYGEWLVPHTLKTYREDAWRKFWIFDVYDNEGKALSYQDYLPLISDFGLDFIPPIYQIDNPSVEKLYDLLEKNTFLIEDDKGVGEGIVVKNYGFYNRFGDQVWGKIVRNAFKEEMQKVWKTNQVGGLLLEEQVIRDFLTPEFILKEQAKIINVNEGWESKYIPELLGRVWFNFLNEETYNFVKKLKNPALNFGLLNKLAIQKTKEVINV